MSPDRRNYQQTKLPFREPVITTSLITGRIEPRMRNRKRFPGSETNYESIQNVNNWWSEQGKSAFHRSLKAWGNVQSELSREVGESTNLGSAWVDEGEATEDFTKVLLDAKKKRLAPFEIVKRIKTYGSLLKQEQAREARVLDEYYMEVIKLMDNVFTFTSSRRETFLAFLRYQKTLQ